MSDDEKKAPTAGELIRAPEPYQPTRRCADCDCLAVFDGRDEYFPCTCPCNRVSHDNEPYRPSYSDPDDYWKYR